MILFELLGFWMLLMWIGWVLIFSGAKIVDVKTGAPGNVPTRIHFIGAQMFTSGSAEYVVRGDWWHILSTIAAGSGLFVMTMAITYLLAVLGAAVEKRSAAAFIWDMGGTPERIIGRSWDGKQFTDLYAHLVEVDTAIELFAEQHLAYPILQYFHSENRRTAAPLRLPALYETLLLIRYGAQEHVRPPKLLLESSLDAICGLASNGIPCVPLEEFGAAVDDQAEIRRTCST